MHESFEAATTDSKTRYAGKLATTFDLPELRIRTSDATRRETWTRQTPFGWLASLLYLLVYDILYSASLRRIKESGGMDLYWSRIHTLDRCATRLSLDHRGPSQAQMLSRP